MKQLHEVQIKILEGLLFTDKAKYSELKPVNMENSKFVFHLDKLIDLGLVSKSEKMYSLTDKGKEYANQITTESMKVEKQAKITTILCACRDKNGKKEYLVYKRLKNPFYGCVGFPTEKPKWEEKIEAAARRGLKEEANLIGIPKLFAIRHYLVYSSGKFVEDKLMHAYLFDNPEGKLEGNIEGDFFWVKESEVKKKVNPALEEFDEVFSALIIFDGTISFKEIEIKTDKF